MQSGSRNGPAGCETRPEEECEADQPRTIAMHVSPAAARLKWYERQETRWRTLPLSGRRR